MADEATVTDSAGITRSPDGQITDGQTTQSDQSQTTTTQSTDSTGKSLLNESETKTDDKTTTKTDDKPEGKKDEKSSGAPEKYSDYKVPDGYALDPAVKTEVDALFKGMNLTQDQAQSLVDFYTAKATESAKAPYDAYREMTSQWAKDAADHPDLRGKLGAGKEVNVRIAKFLDGIGDQKLASDFRELMDLTGAGNHPAFIRVLNYAASRLTEGSHVSGNGPSKAGQSRPGEAPASAAAAIWPGLPSANSRQ